MKRTLVIADLARDPSLEHDEVTLTRAQMQRIAGGRDKIPVTVDGGPGTATIDTFDLNNAIWEGRIGGTMIQ